MITYRIICNLIIIILAFIGLYLGFNSINSLLYFTALSNILMLLICIIMVYLDIFKKNIPQIVYIIKYIFTVAIAVTGIIYFFVLAPMYLTACKVYDVSSVFLHVLVPIFSIISYLFFDKKIVKKNSYLYGLVTPLFYFLLVMILSISDNCYFTILGQPSKFPYFFLDYTTNGFFTISSSLAKAGVCYWYIIIIAFTMIISKFLYFLKNRGGVYE